MPSQYCFRANPFSTYLATTEPIRGSEGLSALHAYVSEILFISAVNVNMVAYFVEGVFTNRDTDPHSPTGV